MNHYLPIRSCQTLAELFGRRAPRPIADRWWCINSHGDPLIHPGKLGGDPYWPAYELHDLLDFGFCNLMATYFLDAGQAIRRVHSTEETARHIRDLICSAYYNAGWSRVEYIINDLIEKNKRYRLSPTKAARRR